MIALFLSFGRGTRPASYAVPLMPFIPGLSVGLNTFLLGQLDSEAWIRFAIWTAVVTGAPRRERARALHRVRAVSLLHRVRAGCMH